MLQLIHGKHNRLQPTGHLSRLTGGRPLRGGLLAAAAVLAASLLLPRMVAGAADTAEAAPAPKAPLAAAPLEAYAAVLRLDGGLRAMPVVEAADAAEEPQAAAEPTARSADLPCLLTDDGPVPAAEAPADASVYYPHVWPVVFSEVGYISSGFGWRTDPITGAKGDYHQAVDFADRHGSRIYASAAGRVVSVGSSSGYGLNLVLDHGNGYQTRYAHCSRLLVEAGDTVEQGQFIALMGATGRATGTHLDFRVYLDGAAIDPMLTLDPVA